MTPTPAYRRRSAHCGALGCEPRVVPMPVAWVRVMACRRCERVLVVQMPQMDWTEVWA